MNEGHLIFGEKVVEKFDLPIDTSWALALDYGVWFESHDINLYLHRLTLHGMDNVEKCMEVMRETGLIEYDPEYREEIRTLVVSHSFLDLFNGPILPSYPSSTDFKFIFDQLGSYAKVALNDPPLLDELFEEIVDEADSLSDLEEMMIEEYEMLPWKKGKLTERILEHYREHKL